MTIEDGPTAGPPIEVHWDASQFAALLDAAEERGRQRGRAEAIADQKPVIEAAPLLWALYEAWGASASVEPTSEQIAAGWAELISLEDSKRLDVAFSAIDDRAAEIHAAIAALAALGPVNPEERA